MDRTTLGRNILPLEREGLISIKPGRTDRRSKELRLTDAGLERLRLARKAGRRRSKGSPRLSGEERTMGLRALLHEVVGAPICLQAARRRPRLNPIAGVNRHYHPIGPNRRIYALMFGGKERKKKR